MFHAAGYYPRFRERRKEAIERGLRSTRRLLEQLRRMGPARIVFTSSAATIRRVPGRPATEADAEPWPPAEWRPLYATVKLAMEHEVLEACRGGLPAVVVNPSLCVGEYDARPFSGRAVLAFARPGIPVYVRHTFNAVYTGDVAIGHLRAAERGRLGERYLLVGRNVTLREFATLVARAADVCPPRWRVPYGLVWAAAVSTEAAAWLARTEPLLPRGAVHSLRMGQLLDGTKALRELALPQTPLEEAIRRALAWFKLLPSGIRYR
ncbi:MAG: NAD-dependent epimerase/dehydratase family protein [Candidatus Omnitrophica bacterium]|nr:NAD-dependent epimerase/dehydratase family protein [Candidatus Omnitrophota bacterium]